MYIQIEILMYLNFKYIPLIRDKLKKKGVSYSKRVAYYIHLAAAPNPWVGSPGKCGPMVG